MRAHGAQARPYPLVGRAGQSCSELVSSSCLPSAPRVAHAARRAPACQLSTFLSGSAQPSSPARPQPRPAQTISAGAEEDWVRVCSSPCGFPTEPCLSCLQPSRRSFSLPPSVSHGVDPPNSRSGASPSSGFLPLCPAQEDWGFLLVLAHFCLTTWLLLPQVSLSPPSSLPPLTNGFAAALGVQAAPVMSPWFLVSCTLSRKVTGPDNIIYIAV